MKDFMKIGITPVTERKVICKYLNSLDKRLKNHKLLREQFSPGIEGLNHLMQIVF